MSRVATLSRRFADCGFAVAVAMSVVACGKNDGATTTAVADKKFPGYQQVGNSGDAAQLWFNPTDITRNGSSYVVHTLKAFPEGYARFDVLTNCRDATKRLGGTQYRADGTADKDYPGNDEAVSAKSEPGMAELMTTACGVAMASRSIQGEFNVPAALELLYGPYDAQSKTASWSDAAVPSDLPWRENLQLSGGKPLAVTGMATFVLSEGGQEKKILVTNAVPVDGGCHACTGLLGVAIFKKDGNAWKIDSNQPYVASMGAMGSVGSRFEWAPAGDDKYALIVSGGDMHQGYQTAYTTAFVRGKDGKFVSIVDDGDTGASDTESVDVKTSFVKGKDPAHYDIKVAFSYSIPGQADYVADHIYQYSGGKYVLVKKDDPPKVIAARGSDEGAAISSAATSKDGYSQASSQQVAASPSFDCQKAKSDAERLICSDAELASQDVALANLFEKAKAAVTDKAAFRERVREQWNYRESACHDRECLVRWYTAQREFLSGVARTGRLD
ncbi:lysozyme inhibitor LprI family protein [Paraburkholderia kururiensis]|uniref:lysozyme inhibitor LprI family protein n=1 Tax=Paraburkholderia kururiensis TaxID=984307 RepID=UPI000A55F227|nr:hypothetical protein [Paraburkholderia kururiensis]